MGVLLHKALELVGNYKHWRNFFSIFIFTCIFLYTQL